MPDIPALLDQLHRWGTFIALYWGPAWLPDPKAWAIAALIVGVVLCGWGGRILRGAYLLLFLALGAAFGAQTARAMDIDVLIGLVIGAGLSAVLGYLLYRWWVAMTLALMVGTAACLVGAPWLLNEARGFADALLEQTIGRRVFVEDPATVTWAPQLAGPAGEEPPRLRPGEVLRAFGQWVWDQRPDECRRVLVLAGIAAVLGLLAGLLFPRLVVVLGTSGTGAVLIGLGLSDLILRYRLAAWEWVQAHSTAVFACWIALVGVSVIQQMRLMKGVRSSLAAGPAPPPRTA